MARRLCRNEIEFSDRSTSVAGDNRHDALNITATWLDDAPRENAARPCHVSDPSLRAHISRTGIGPRRHFITLLTNLISNKKALSRGHTNQIAHGFTYLQFPIQVCSSSMLPDLVFPTLLSFAAKNEHFPPVTLNFGL